jgi:hypothetical protein
MTRADLSGIELARQHEPGDDTEERVRRALAILLDDREGHGEGQAA